MTLKPPAPRTPDRNLALRARNLLREAQTVMAARLAPMAARKAVPAPRAVVGVSMQAVMQEAAESQMADNVDIIDGMGQAHAYLLESVVPEAQREEVLGAHIKGVRDYLNMGPMPITWPLTHRHVRRGSRYGLVFAQVEIQSDVVLREGDTLVVYVGEDGKAWARPPAEFDDGRFRPLEPAERG